MTLHQATTPPPPPLYAYCALSVLSSQESGYENLDDSALLSARLLVHQLIIESYHHHLIVYEPVKSNDETLVVGDQNLEFNPAMDRFKTSYNVFEEMPERKF
ncbi:hypothetical protein R6Q59_015171 [Mikania micrantha]